MRKLLLQCGLAPGDIVMLTAAVRDLHRCHPGRFVTDVRTCCPELWEHNPRITPLVEDDSEVETINCSYPLINRCDRTPYHCLHGFIEFLNDRLGLSIKPTAFRGDIHLSPQEKAWYSQVREVTRQDVPFWIVAAGGKYDVTIKWWSSQRYQEVVDRFRGRIQFVQVGAVGHHHPKLEGVIDLRGQTTLRELIRLVYHAEGVLCSVTALMHLAAAVEQGPGRRGHRPCVVVAGGREPAHWEAYPGQQFIHTNGSLRCCYAGGCWRDRSIPLRDGDRRDDADHRCVDLRGDLPRCMDLITAEDVVRRIEMYYAAGRLKYLTPRQQRAAERGVRATLKNPYDQQPLNLHSAGMACEEFVQNLPSIPGSCEGRGIVICAGGTSYYTNAWVCINMLRRLGCRLPVQVWYLGRKEKDEHFEKLLKPLAVQCIDAFKIRKQHPARILGGWQLKPYAILHSPFREVLLLDADNVPVVNPEFLFESRQFQETGAVFWPDYEPRPAKRSLPVWRSCGLKRPSEPEFESGQVLVDKQRCWRALRLTLWFNENSDFYYQHLHGDKETFHLAFRKLNQPYVLVRTPLHPLTATMCQHDLEGRRAFQHRNADKWDLFLANRRVTDFWFEEECRGYVRALQRSWDGGLSARLNGQLRGRRGKMSHPIRIQGLMISCAERAEVRRRTLEDLARTDWGEEPVHVQIDQSTGEDYCERQTRCAREALQFGVRTNADYLLLLEDDLQFNRYLRHNLIKWRPLEDRRITLASLYNPGLRELACDLPNRARILSPSVIFASQAFVMSRATARFVVENWNRVREMQDIRISRLAGRLNRPILYHAPSLVQHVGTESACGKFHQATDFDPTWKAR